MEIIKTQTNPLFLFGIILVALFMTVYFFIYGIPDTNDSFMHFSFASSIYDAVSHGEIVLSGEPNANNGYGGYALRYYPSFSHYTLALAYFLTGHWHYAGFLFFWFWMAVSGYGLYLLAQEWVDEKIAFIAAILFLFEPYHNAQTSSLYAYAEFVAGCLLPFCFLFMTRVLKYGKLIDMVGLAAFYALLILTHIPITLIGSIGLGIYGLSYLFISKDWKDRSLKLFAGVSFGVLAASFYLYRLFAESSWIQFSQSRFLNEGGYDFRIFFIDIRGFFFPSDLVLFNFLILLIPPAVLILLKAERELKKSAFPLILITFFSIFMGTSYSQPIWEILVPLQKVQFPWRWLAVASVGYGIIIAISISVLVRMLPGKKLILCLWSGFFVISSAYFSYSYIIGANLLDADFFLLHNHEFNSTVNFKSKDPYLDFLQTTWTKRSAFQTPEQVLAPPRVSQITKWDRFSKEVKISAGEPTRVRLAVTYLPHWKARVNGTEVEVSKTEDGVVLVPVTQAESVIELNFVEPFGIKFFLFISAATWLTLLGLMLLNLRKKFLPQATQDQNL